MAQKRLLIKFLSQIILQRSNYLSRINRRLSSHPLGMLFRTRHLRHWPILLAVLLTAAGIVGFTGISWCTDWETSIDRMELASCHPEGRGQIKISLMPCGATSPPDTGECTACLEITTQSLSGWRIGDDRPKVPLTSGPSGNCYPFIHFPRARNPSDTPHSILLAAKTSPPGLTIQSQALRSVVLLI